MTSRVPDTRSELVDLFQDVLEGWLLVGALRCQRLLRVVVVQDGGDGVAHSSLVAPEEHKDRTMRVSRGQM